ncbi:MAG: C25 family cysteine peptidase, partial [Promethearchaeota archaeon]
VNGNDILDEEDYLGFDTNRNHNWIKENIIPSDWDCILLAETEGVQTTQYSYDYSINASMIEECVNEGVSIFMSDAHGSPTSTVRSIFTNDVDADGLYDWGIDSQAGQAFLSTSSEFDTRGMLGLYFLAACSTGTFVGHNCLTEYITRTSGIGAIGSSQSAYYDPGWYEGATLGWYTQGLLERFWRQIFSVDGNHPGRALALAKDDYASDYVAESPDAYDGGRTLSQYNLMGDPEVPIWLDIPSNLGITITSNNETGVITVHATAEGSSVTGAIVTIVGESILQREITDSTGAVQFSIPDLQDSENVTITASKNGFIPSAANTSVSPVASEPADGNPLVFELAVISGTALVALVLVVLVAKKRA